VREALIDTDILSFFFRGEPTVVDKFKNYLKEFEALNISIITYYEVLSGLKFKKAERQIQLFEEFVKNNTIIHLTEGSAKVSSEIYADLRKMGITIGTSDLLIAGIAIVNELTLISNNERHYASIKGLSIENWTR
jgi:tRNA(fMet)-specific endonuclease VapC